MKIKIFKILTLFSLLAFPLLWQFLGFASFLFALLPLIMIYKEIFSYSFAKKVILNEATLKEGNIFHWFMYRRTILRIFCFFAAILLVGEIFHELFVLGKLEYIFIFIFLPFLFLLSKKVFLNYLSEHDYNKLKIIILASLLATLLFLIFYYFEIRNHELTSLTFKDFMSQNANIYRGSENIYLDRISLFFNNIKQAKLWFLSYQDYASFSLYIVLAFTFLSSFFLFIGFNHIVSYILTFQKGEKDFHFNLFFKSLFTLLYISLIFSFTHFVDFYKVKIVKANYVPLCGSHFLLNAPDSIRALLALNEDFLDEQIKELNSSLKNATYENMDKTVKFIADKVYSTWFDYIYAGKWLKGIFSKEPSKDYMNEAWDESLEKFINPNFTKIVQEKFSFIKGAYEKTLKSFVKEGNLLSQKEVEDCLQLDGLLMDFTKKSRRDLSLSLGIGTAAGVKIGSKFAAKMATKTATKTAAKATAKTATKTAASAGSGALAGAAVGSVGGPIGAAAGAIIGSVATFVGADLAINYVDEKITRQKFEKELAEELELYSEEFIKNIDKSLRAIFSSFEKKVVIKGRKEDS